MNLYFALARQAMCEGLRLLGATQGSRIAVPRFICSDVTASLCCEGYLVVPYEITNQLQPDFSSPRPDAEYVLIVNYFGFACDVNSVVRVWGFTARQILEDNAHGLFSRDSENRWLGQRTAIGFTSFRKTIRVRDGGILSVNDSTLAMIAESRELQPEARPNPWGLTFRHLSAALSHRTGLPLMNISRMVKRRFVGVSAQSFDSDSRVPTAVSSSSLTALEACDVKAETMRRRSLYERLVPLVERCGGIALFPDLPKGVVPYALPLLARPETLKELRRALWRRDLEVFQWPDLSPNDLQLPEWQRHLSLVSFLK